MRAFRTALPFALALLVVVLGIFQYRWLGQVAEVERQEMRASLLRRAQDFSSEFNREVTQLYSALSLAVLSPESASPSQSWLGSATAMAYKQWRADARFAGLVKGAYLFSRAMPTTADGIDLGSGAVTTQPFPASLSPVVDQMGSIDVGEDRGGTRSEVRRFVAMGGSPFASRIPALVIWLPDQLPFRVPTRLPDVPPSVDIMLRPAIGQQALIVELDRTYIRDVMLPALLDRYFPGGGSGPVAPPILVDRATSSAPARLQVVDAAGAPVLSRGLASGASITTESADVVVPFFIPGAEDRGTPGLRVVQWTNTKNDGRLQGEVAVHLERRATELETVARDQQFFTLAIESWHIRVQHAAGSLDAAVAIGRRRNLALSFGILGVLVAAVALVIGNARRAERLAGQQLQFVAAVSHELRTPLAVIRSAAENISAGIVKDPEQTIRYGQLIESEGRRLTEMVEQVLSHAGIGAGGRRHLRVRPVDVGAVVADAVAGTAAARERAGCQVVVDVESGVPPVMADELLLRSALDNLLTNALKHASDGGYVAVSAAKAAGQPAAVEIRVTDKGAGVEPGDVPHLFEPFYRGQRAVEKQTPGSGLGLSVVKNSIEQIGGRVAYQPAPGGGSSFVLVLPTAPPDAGSDIGA
jgi:signal transduction histidine kinase